jgi:hypothetical protein
VNTNERTVLIVMITTILLGILVALALNCGTERRTCLAMGTASDKLACLQMVHDTQCPEVTP